MITINIAGGNLNPESFAWVKPNEIPTTTSSYEVDTYFGKDAAGNDYKVKDIADKPVLLTYSKKGLEVYFYGRLNEKYHWDGFCVTNAYYQKDGSLYSVCESNFEDGKRINFKSFYQTNDDKTEWIYTDRICEKDGNFGMSQKWSIKNAVKRNFRPEAVQIQDVLYISDALAKSNDKILLSYYYGWTSDGTYNDTSGTAYYLRYNDEGKILTFYVGGFRNGDFNDQSGKAIELVYDGSRYFIIRNLYKREPGQGRNQQRLCESGEDSRDHLGYKHRF